MQNKRIIVSVINDLVTDQRVYKSCKTLKEEGYDILLVGRKLPNSLPMDDRPYPYKRMKLLFTKGPLFYAFFNVRLLFFLLFWKADGLHANDLDTLLANYIASKIKRIPLVYDSHEYFTEVPEIQGRFAQKAWKKLEQRIFPHLQNVITVNDSIAHIYQEQYGNKVHVMRNLPLSKKETPKAMDRASLGIEEEEYLVLIQGAGINIDRGAEEAVLSMQFLKGVRLLVIGGGDVMPILHKLTDEHHLQEKVLFIPRQLPAKLPAYTAMADLGLSLDKDSNLNYRLSLPNKIFDYVSCGVPVLASRLPEVEKIVTNHQLGLIASSHNPADLALMIEEARHSKLKEKLKSSLDKAGNDLCWEMESRILARLWNEQFKDV